MVLFPAVGCWISSCTVSSNQAKAMKASPIKRMKIDMHLMDLYQNAAGMLPTKFFVLSFDVCSTLPLHV